MKNLTPTMKCGLEMLQEAFQYAEELERDRWDFAVEIEPLWEAGVNNSELRWMVCKGYAEHAEEETGLSKNGRSFRDLGKLTFSSRSCFVLTEAGLSAFQPLVPQAVVEPPPRKGWHDGRPKPAKQVVMV